MKFNILNLIKEYAYFSQYYSWIKHTLLSAALKRVLDVSVSFLALILLSPVLIIVTILVKVSDNGPVLYWQCRVGKYGELFWFPKFRSMIPNAEKLKDQLLDDNLHKDGITFKIKNDPRITKLGRIMRRLSIDELPQFFCVLKGDMTLVGPRPAISREVQKYSLEERRRLDVKPGLTCIWQVSGRSNIPFEKQILMDVKYIESFNNYEDVKLIAKTIPAIISGKGAY